MTLLDRPRLRLLATMVLLALAAGPLTIALASLSGIGHRWVDLLAQFVAPALLAGLVLVALALIARLRTTALVMGAVVLLVMIAGAPQWFPDRGTPADDQAVGIYFANLYARNEDIDAVSASIRAANPDIVILIEVGDAVGGGLDGVLAAYPHRNTTPRRTMGSGPARSIIASRWPLTPLEPELPQVHGVTAVTQTPIGPITMAGVHLTRPWPYQFQWGQIIQAQQLIDWRRRIEGPVVVAGDFNSVSSARIGRMVRREAGLVAAPAWPGTWHAAMPAWAAITIDQVYRSPDLALIERSLGRANGSDHRPVLVRVVRAEAPPAA